MVQDICMIRLMFSSVRRQAFTGSEDICTGNNSLKMLSATSGSNTFAYIGPKLNQPLLQVLICVCLFVFGELDIFVRWKPLPEADVLSIWLHDDVIKWKYFPRYCPFVRGNHRWPVNSPHKGQLRWALMFSLICAWINDWVNYREAGYLKRHRTHYDVIVMHWNCLHIYCTGLSSLFEMITSVVTSHAQRVHDIFSRWRQCRHVLGKILLFIGEFLHICGILKVYGLIPS